MYSLLHSTSSDGRFDFINAIHSLYYAENASETVELLYRSLAPGGILMIEMSDGKILERAETVMKQNLLIMIKAMLNFSKIQSN